MKANCLNKVLFLDNGCIQWTGCRSKEGKGYALFQCDGKLRVLHRYLFIYWEYDVPDSMHLDHKCRNMGCINIDCLDVVTPRVNVVVRGTGVTAQQALKTHCPRGHLYDYVNTSGSRTCTKCQYWLTKNSRLRRAGKDEVWPDWWTITSQRKEDGAWE